LKQNRLLEIPPVAAVALVPARQISGPALTQYKQATIARRLNRRMLVRKTDTLEEYVQLIQKEPRELDALFDDLLINVTDFFRDPDVFEAAKRLAFPSIVQHRKLPHTIRAWIPGCSSGEEVYSLAIALTEFLESEGLGCTLQVFGTDVSERAIEAARKAVYARALSPTCPRSVCEGSLCERMRVTRSAATSGRCASSPAITWPRIRRSLAWILSVAATF
jgi:chemotaxis methyl-accepting protein methylase